MVSGYIQQEDLFIGTLTIREHLWFTAKLRMPRGTSDSERTSRVDESIQELGLTRSQNTLIGIPGFLKGISGGEKKRLALAAELLNNPKIMFADEPTSGLDSFMAASVVECLINLANRGRTVLCTIHQPSSDVYAMFPQIMLLSEGKTVYFGATVQLPSFFAECVN
ncbi:hypothetical protein CAPTEDRAFT_114484 [Capitella teleta]|uniref:ABC transporter domain-containing protein n=1 Tax=Capitella teleta TaxID=283909 RepID=R7UFR1_CAPTE|nr:hypothetical protein CAPTEDRAFT_114484 [Capitella teleta]|eukprot:ELU02633.1 hypothetical protein CAPTEDRAFT_114484 [Capitella teleta]